MICIATHTDTTPLQAPGGARMGSATLARLSRTGETKARATDRIAGMEQNQAGGPDAALFLAR